jgi:hypothetical protein
MDVQDKLQAKRYNKTFTLMKLKASLIRDSLVGIAKGYGQDGWTGVRSPIGAR